MFIFAFFCLFGDVIGFCNNVFEKKRDEKARRKNHKICRWWQKLFFLKGYPRYRRLGHYLNMSIVALDVVTQIWIWISPKAEETLLFSVVIVGNLFVLWLTYGFACMQSVVYSYSTRKNSFEQGIDIFLGALGGLAIIGTGVLLVFAVFLGEW